MNIKMWLPKQWEKIGFWHLFLWPLSFLFYLISTIRKMLYRYRFLISHPLPVPVIVVGNINAGGTGKTPVVLALCEHLKNLGFHPGVISRGYGGTSKTSCLVTEESDPICVGDEPVLIAKMAQCPVWIGRNRVQTAHQLLSHHLECDILISDDGLQHYALQREIEIVVIDGERLFGNHYVLPAGPLREPISRLRQVDSLILNQSREQTQIQTVLQEIQTPRFKMSLQFLKCYNLQDPTCTVSLEMLAEKQICAMAGIGHPERFFMQLESYGLKIKAHAFPDHHIYTRTELDRLCPKEAVLLMTEKDAVKCQAFAQPNYWVIQVNPEIEEAFYVHLDLQLQKLKQFYTEMSVLKN